MTAYQGHRRLVRRRRWLLLSVGLVLLAAVVVALVFGFFRPGVVRPGGKSPAGSSVLEGLRDDPKQIARIKAMEEGVTTPFGKQVIADGKVSREEMQEAQSKYVNCMLGQGFISYAENPDGSGKAEYPHGWTDEEIRQKENTCYAATDWMGIGLIYFQQQIDPDNVDPDVLQFRCLVRKKALPKSFTMADWERVHLDESSPYFAGKLSQDAKVAICLGNPSEKDAGLR